jgi:WD40 repeat protein
MTMKDISTAEGACFCLEVNPINSIIYGGGYDGSVTLYDTSQKAAVMSFAAHSEPVASISSCPNGVDFATGGSDGVVRIWDARYLSCCKHTIGTYNNTAM